MPRGEVCSRKMSSWLTGGGDDGGKMVMGSDRLGEDRFENGPCVWMDSRSRDLLDKTLVMSVWRRRGKGRRFVTCLGGPGAAWD